MDPHVQHEPRHPHNVTTNGPPSRGKTRLAPVLGDRRAAPDPSPSPPRHSIAYTGRARLRPLNAAAAECSENLYVFALKSGASILTLWRSIVGLLQVASRMMLLALIAANLHGLVSIATNIPLLGRWLGLGVAVGSVLLGLAAFLTVGVCLGQLNRLTACALVLPESCGRATIPLVAGRGRHRQTVAHDRYVRRELAARSNQRGKSQSRRLRIWSKVS